MTFAAPAIPGRTEVQDRVLNGVARAAAAECLGVPTRSVRASVSAYGSGLAVHVRSPLTVPNLLDAAAVESTPVILDRLDRAQSDLQARLADLLGRDIARVDLTITGAEVAKRRRLR
ncbi:hypothetical protein [Leucobacter japonicus]|uniref:hypothetical protein n=1 Tax=Leucobacter japonicus TaxID=1461259 RepID=UPI0006A7CAC4|nr:hypothetical protein [Leucobacter japonicus]